MKRFFKLIPVALALVALASCSNDDLFEKSGSKAVDGKTMQATIEDYSNMTRAAFAENKTDGKVDARALVWTAGDSYKVYGELATPDKYTVQNSSVGKKSATFDCMTEDYNTEPKFAVFPYDKVDANRAENKLTVTLTDWTYGTAEVKEDGYSEGGFVSNVPMYGKCDDAGDAAFGYMTGILRVDLSALPKKMTRLIVVTDRPLTGTFETEFDPTAATAEIVSPVSNDETTEEYDFIDDGAKTNVLYYKKDNTVYTDYANGLYFLEVGTESVSKRTNKTFFIAVPTGNKYKVFDLLIEYNMGSTKKYELVGQLGNTARIAESKSVLNWQRGKVKSLTKEITVTSQGNTPKAISEFLAAEWKSFPEGDEINITVDKGDGSADATKIVLDGSDNDIFTVPAELKNKVVNIIAEDYSADGTLKIIDEDPAPVASTALRKINFIVPSTKNVIVNINAPETQLEFDGVSDTETALYTSFKPAVVAIGDLANEEPGLTIGEFASVTTLVQLKGGSLLTLGAIAGLNNSGDNDVLIKNNATNMYTSGAGDLTIEGQLADDGSIVNTIGTINANGTGDISVENVQDVTIASVAAFTGAITINNVEKVTGVTVTANDEHNAPITITGVTTDGVAAVNYAGLAAVTIDDVIGGSTTGISCTNAKATGDLKVTNLKTAKDLTTGATVAAITYAGNGNVEVSGVANNKGVYPVVTTTTLTAATPAKASSVTFTDVTVGTSLEKNSTGALTITGVRAAFGTITNADGAITITGNNVSGANIASLTQNGTGAITLKDISNATLPTGVPNTPGVVTALTVNKATTINYENTFIATLTGNTTGGNYNVTANGTKSSGIGTVTANKAKITFTTDTWDGTSWCKVASANIYTSGSLVGLIYHSTETDIDLLVSNSEINLGGNNFQLFSGAAAMKGINKAITKLEGGKYTSGDPAVPVPFTIKNLKAESGLFAYDATTPRTANLEVDYVTLDAPVITATQDAGAFVGIANGANHTFIACKVNNATIASASTGKGTDINLGGFIGQVDATGKDVLLQGCHVTTASIKGHYYMGGFIGQVVDATKVKIHDVNGAKVDEKGSTVSGITFTPLSADNAWSTLKCGTIAPFIGGIKAIATELNIYGKFDSFDREANKWKLNFLSNESYKFIGTKEDACNFIGYIDVSTVPGFKYYLKNLNGFEADISTGMKIVTTTDAGKPLSEILATECNAYAEY